MHTSPKVKANQLLYNRTTSGNPGASQSITVILNRLSALSTERNTFYACSWLCPWPTPAHNLNPILGLMAESTCGCKNENYQARYKAMCCCCGQHEEHDTRDHQWHSGVPVPLIKTLCAPRHHPAEIIGSQENKQEHIGPQDMVRRSLPCPLTGALDNLWNVT